MKAAVSRVMNACLSSLLGSRFSSCTNQHARGSGRTRVVRLNFLDSTYFIKSWATVSDELLECLCDMHAAATW